MYTIIYGELCVNKMPITVVAPIYNPYMKVAQWSSISIKRKFNIVKSFLISSVLKDAPKNKSNFSFSVFPLFP